MIYHDFNRLYKHQAKSRKFLPATGREGRRSKPLVNPYQVKFYAVILLVLLSTYFYIRYQVVHQTDSVFTDFARFISTQKLKYSGDDKITDNTVTEKKPITAEPTRSETAKSEAVMIYYPLNEKGRIRIVPVKSEISYTGSVYSPLFSTLLKSEASKQNMFNSFSQNVRVLRAWVENDVLLIDFSREFEYNRFGYRGLELQIQQVLWTAFRLRNDEGRAVERVGFLIEGKRKNRIGGEGLELKPFYSRGDLKRVITHKNDV